MKNLHYFKKFAVMVLAAMMTLSTFALPTFAAGAAMTISGVDYQEVKDGTGQVTSKTEVEGYQIISKDSNNNWKPSAVYFDLYKLDNSNNEVSVNATDFKDATIWKVKGTNITYPVPSPTNTDLPSGDALQALAKIAQSKVKDIDFTYDSTTDSFKNTDDAKGSFLVLVKNNTSTETYNPMLVSRDDSGTAQGVIAATGNGTAYAKKSDIPFEKVVERTTHQSDANASNKPNDKATGDGLTTSDDASATDGNFDGTVDGNKGDTAGSKTSGATKTNGVITGISYDSSTGKFSTDGTTVYDDVWFRINTKVPDYADNYFDTSFTTRPQFIVYDTLSEGLTFNDVQGDGTNLGMSVKVGNDTIYTSNNDVTITKLPNSGAYNGKTFVVEFTETGLKKYKAQPVEICYSAKLNAKHSVNFDGETNTASLEYTRNPGEAPKKGEDKTTYHYTFTINGKVDANAQEENREVIKIGLDNNGNQVMNETQSKTETGWTPLEGVIFELQDKNGKVVKEVITDANGILRGMEQIDAGEYQLVEKSLPAQYSQYQVNSTPIPVVIDATLDSVGRLESYKVLVNGITVGNYKKVYNTGSNDIVQFLDDNNNVVAQMECKNNAQGDPVTNVGTLARHTFSANNKRYNYSDTDTEAADIINSKVGTLPSTGGMGTVLFTVGGIAIMALALFLLFGAKKKEEQK